MAGVVCRGRGQDPAGRGEGGEVGAAAAERDRRIQVAEARATAQEGENESAVRVAQSDSLRRKEEAEAERDASAAEKVKAAQALQEAYAAQEESEVARASREQATQRADVVVPAEIRKEEIATLAEAEAERNRPSEFGEKLTALSDEQAQAIAAMLGEGMDPDDVAELVFKSIVEQRCYILPHHGWDDVVRGRVEAVLAREAPIAIDFEELLRRRATGEQI